MYSSGRHQSFATSLEVFELDQQLFTIEETRAITRLGRSMLYEKLRNGELRSVTIGRSRRIPKSAIEDFVRRLEREHADL
jgi:excisionase family DNA binding protein